jgi:hypothetical protein
MITQTGKESFQFPGKIFMGSVRRLREESLLTSRKLSSRSVAAVIMRGPFWHIYSGLMFIQCAFRGVLMM